MKKTINPLKLVIGVLGLSSVAALVGSISGTVAWYAYSTRAVASYRGTSAQSSAQLQIGLKSEKSISELENDELIETVVTSVNNVETYYYFIRLGSGGLPSRIINLFLGGNGFATTVLEPVSSYSYTTGGTFTLENCPTTNRPNERSSAPKSKYATIPFVFRSFKTGENGIANSTSVKDEKIYLSGASTSAEEGKIDKAIRMYIDRNGKNDNNQNLSDFILNPNANGHGSIKVGGVLDLSGNGYFDYENNQGSSYLHEFLYGDCVIKQGVTWEEQEDSDSALHDINETGNNNATTFTSKHRKGTYHLPCDSENPLENYVDIGTAEYLGTGDVLLKKYDKDVEPKPDFLENYVCKTDTEITDTLTNHASYVGSFNMTIYIEGWDYNTINQHGNKQFNLGLTFAIDTVS